MLSVLLWIFWLPKLGAQLPNLPASSLTAALALDSLLQDYAYRAFVRPRTGTVYDGNVPSNLTGIKISALRLRRGSLRSRGVQAYKEFKIPMGVVVQPHVARLVLVYQNLGNWSSVYYPLANYKYLAPVLGLLAYDASNLSAKNLPKLNITATRQPISINFSAVKTVADGSVAKCVWFDLDGLVNFSDPVSDNTCSTSEQGHFSIVIESIAPSPSPVSPVPPAGAPMPTGGGKKNHTTLWIILGSVLGGLVALVLLGFLALWVAGYKQRKQMQQMERAAEVGESLQMTSVGSTKAPAATVTRTQPTLESEYVP